MKSKGQAEIMKAFPLAKDEKPDEALNPAYPDTTIPDLYA
jgi:hypothetical protein